MCFISSMNIAKMHRSEIYTHGRLVCDPNVKGYTAKCYFHTKTAVQNVNNQISHGKNNLPKHQLKYNEKWLLLG